MFLIFDENTHDVLKVFWYTQEQEANDYLNSIATKDNWVSLCRVALIHETK